MLDGVFNGSDYTPILSKVVRLMSEVLAELREFGAGSVLNHNTVTGWTGISSRPAIRVRDDNGTLDARKLLCVCGLLIFRQVYGAIQYYDVASLGRVIKCDLQDEVAPLVRQAAACGAVGLQNKPGRTGLRFNKGFHGWIKLRLLSDAVAAVVWHNLAPENWLKA